MDLFFRKSLDRKVMLHYFFILLAIFFFSCQKNSDNFNQNIEKLSMTENSPSVKIDFSELEQVDTTQWLYGVKVYQVVNGIESCYAYGLFSEIDSIRFIPEFDKKYYFQTTAINKGTGRGVYNTFNAETGVYRYYSPIDAELTNQFNYECPTRENWYFDPASNFATLFGYSGGTIRAVNAYMPELIRYYGESDTLTIHKDEKNIHLELINVSFGVNTNIENMQEGDTAIIVLNQETPALLNTMQIVYPDTTALHYYEFGDIHARIVDYFKTVINPEIPRHQQVISYVARILHKDGTHTDIPQETTEVIRNKTTPISIKAR